LKYSLPLLPHSFSGWAVSMIDRLFLNGYEGLAVPAIYSTGSQFANIINVITVAVNQAYVPWFFEKMKDKEKNELEIVKVSEYTTIIYCFLAMGMSLFGP
ncbi:lipopolysaccharide biosynthesis protein, partial [Clostridium sp. HCS.1]|uniref:lipopolysaccharide biosynthesis protein n=1 Tax=Clostridium sp. HCS.1 TaxID=3238594 RepID=UPI003A0FEA98